MFKFLTFFLLFSQFINQSANAKAHHTGTLSGVTIGARYSSLFEKRGVIFYNDFQIDPAITLFMFDDRLEFWGDTLSYRDFVYEDKIRLRGRVSSISDNPLFPAHDSVRSNQPDRPNTFEFSTAAEFFFPGYNDNYQWELDLTYSKDFSRHYGNYAEALGKIKLTEFYWPLVNKKIEPNLVLGAGIGDKAHNKYYYGPNDEATSMTDYAAGIWLAFPDEADRFFPIIQVMYFAVNGDHRNAQYAKNNNQGYLASFIYTVRLLD
ncbi:MAG: hypothetical protein H7256_00065 [Bdellovibrio sp.]|nr:hypothetical protein [Bdellovibrio sp.]